MWVPTRAEPWPRVDEDRHARKVARVARQLREHRSGTPVSIRKRAVSHKVPKAVDWKYTDDKIDISDLNQILEINPEARYCVAEPGVTFVDLVAATLRYGLVPIIVPELKTITVGGAVAGCSIESMSFKHGGFHDTCTEYEVITGTGEVLTCTPHNEHRLLFQMVHGTFGTLGVISKLRFKLVPATRYVRVRYERYATLAEYQAAIWRHYQAQDIDFMDGMIHSPNLYVLCAADFVEEAPYTHRYDWMRVYYRSTAERREDYLCTPDYFFRYDKGVTNVHPKSLLGRLAVGWFLGSAELLRLADVFHRLLPRERPDVTLDVFIPFSRVPDFMGWYEREFGHFPLWCVPYRRTREYEWIAPGHLPPNEELFLDLAIYGMKQRDGRNYYKLMEDKLLELGGLKTLISHNYFSEEDFWRIWNRENYETLKARVDPHNVFRDLYTKTCGANRPKVRAPGGRSASSAPPRPPPPGAESPIGQGPA